MNAVREWAASEGIEVGKRGRVSKDVFAAYLIAHPSEAREFLKSQGFIVGKRGRVPRSAIYQAVSK